MSRDLFLRPLASYTGTLGFEVLKRIFDIYWYEWRLEPS
jgi:hypothetical protein